MRADAQRNSAHLLNMARTVIDEQGANASLRGIARRAGVGLGTLYRHFPTREDLLEALLRASFDTLTAKADELERSERPGDALVTWFHDIVYLAHSPRGLVSTMAAASQMRNRLCTLRASPCGQQERDCFYALRLQAKLDQTLRVPICLH